MDVFKFLLGFLEKLDERKMHYRINKIRESILIEIAVPGQRWEVEFMADGTVEVEKFLSDGTIFDSGEIDLLLREFSG